MWRARFGRGFGPVVRQTTKWMNKWRTSIWDVPGKTLVSETSYPEIFRSCPQCLKAKVGRVSQIRPWPLSFPIPSDSLLINCSSIQPHKIQLNNSVEQTPSWEAKSPSVSQYIPRIYLNLKVHYSVHKSPPLVRIPSHINPVPIRPISWRSIS